MDYDEAVRASRSDALTLGIQGHSPEANAERAQRAREILTEHAARVEVAYEGRPPWDEIDVPAPFASQLVAEHEGDLAAVLDSPKFDRAIEADMHLDFSPRFVLDESEPLPWADYRTPTVADNDLALDREKGAIQWDLEASGDVAVRERTSAVEDYERMGEERPAQVDPTLKTYDELVSSTDPAAALGLGITGHDSAANARRADLAQAYLSDHETRLASATEAGDAEMPVKPFAADRIVEAGGDLARLLEADGFEREVKAEYASLGAGSEEAHSLRVLLEDKELVERQELPDLPTWAPMPDFTYEELTHETPDVALTLGVVGYDAAANAERGELARAFVERHESDLASFERFDPQGIPPEKPFGVHLVAEADGDLSRVVASNSFEREVAAQSGVLKNDRGEWHSWAHRGASQQDLQDMVTYKTVRIREDLRERQVMERSGSVGYGGDDRHNVATTMTESQARAAMPTRSSQDVAAAAAGQESTTSHSAALTAAGHVERSQSSTRTAPARNVSQTPSKAHQLMSRIKTGLGLERG